ncbi:hypothetical protein [Solidesulfovibrio sp.]|uniref:hypothetical protein n=1 Tax=Solidesulfovibrio sp. TaxID=2910990 RepID=UPI002619C67A|nr:hypothetical protein [Solidesulfovibrio sp.]
MDSRMVQLTLPLSSLPTTHMAAGSLRCLEAVYEAVDAAIKASGLTRQYIADELARLTGANVSEHHINSWTAASKKGERHIPLEYVAALTVILGDARILAAACPAGYVVLSPEEAAIYEMGKVVVEERKRSRRKRELWERINGEG